MLAIPRLLSNSHKYVLNPALVTPVLITDKANIQPIKGVAETIKMVTCTELMPLFTHLREAFVPTHPSARGLSSNRI